MLFNAINSLWDLFVPTHMGKDGKWYDDFNERQAADNRWDQMERLIKAQEKTNQIMVSDYNEINSCNYTQPKYKIKYKETTNEIKHKYEGFRNNILSNFIIRSIAYLFVTFVDVTFINYVLNTFRVMILHDQSVLDYKTGNLNWIFPKFYWYIIFYIILIILETIKVRNKLIELAKDETEQLNKIKRNKR